MLLNGAKSVETRGYALPAHLLHAEIELVEPPRGKPGVSSLGDAPNAGAAVVVGTIAFSRCFAYANADEWRADAMRHRVDAHDEDSPYTWRHSGALGHTKYGWEVSWCTPAAELAATPPMRRLMRSLFVLDDNVAAADPDAPSAAMVGGENTE